MNRQILTIIGAVLLAWVVLHALTQPPEADYATPATAATVTSAAANGLVTRQRVPAPPRRTAANPRNWPDPAPRGVWKSRCDGNFCWRQFETVIEGGDELWGKTGPGTWVYTPGNNTWTWWSMQAEAAFTARTPTEAEHNAALRELAPTNWQPCESCGQSSGGQSGGVLSRLFGGS